MELKFPMKINPSLVGSAVILLSLVGIAGLQKPHLNRILSKSKNASETELKREVKTEKARLNVIKSMPSLGFNNLIADWAMLNFIQYFGDDEARDRTGYELNPQYFDIIVDRDPRFLEAYIFLSNSISIYAGQPEKTVALMEKGLKSLSPDMPPKYYYIWRYKGTDELLFLDKPKEAQRSFEMAAEWASRRSDPESQSVAGVSRRTAEFLSKNAGSKKGRVGAWSMVLQSAVDDRVRKLAIERIEALGGKVIVSPQGGVQILLPKED